MSEPEKNKYSAVATAFKIVLSILFVCLVAAVVIPFIPPHRGNPTNYCINNLRQIDGCKQQWAEENHKSTNDIPTSAELAIYLAPNKFPVCPSGGTYAIGRVGKDPTCSIPGHVLPPP